MVAPSVLLPRVTLDLVRSPSLVGLADQRALIIGQISPGLRASGKITFAANPSAAATITLGGTVWTFVASGATGNQTNIGADLATTLTALASALNASADTNVVKCHYVATPTALFVLYKTGGTAGNSFTLAASAATVSGANLTGGAAPTGTAVAGTLATSLGHTNADIDNLFGKNSHLAQIGRAFIGTNPITNLDALPLADAATATFASAQVAFAGTATRAGSFKISIGSSYDQTFEVDVNVGDTAATVLAALAAAVATAVDPPWTYMDDAASTALFAAVNGGLHANDWVLAVSGAALGITVTLTGWAGGATNPSLTTWSTPITNIRYQTIVWPSSYGSSTVATFLDARKNVTNRILEGRAIIYKNLALVDAQTDALACNSSEVVILNNVPTSQSTYYGPHVPEPPDVLAAKFAAARARRFETAQSIADIVSTNAVNDQFGGPHTASLPYFNTPFLNVGRPVPSTGYDEINQEHAEASGVSVIGVNDSGTQVITGVIVTTYQFDPAGNPDTTWKYLEWRDTHGVVREYIVNNVRKRFEQSRLTTGDINPNYDMANEQLIRGFVLGLCQDLQKQALIVDGYDATQYIKNNLVVTLQPAQRQATINLVYPQVSQLESIIGTVQFTFATAA